MNVYLTIHPKRMLLTCYEWDETHDFPMVN